MTDKEKLDKLVAEIERLYHQSLVDENRQAEWGLSSAACTSYGKSKACKELLSFTDSMQKEPKECMYSKDNYTDEDRKVLCDGCKEECKFNKKDEIKSVHAQHTTISSSLNDYLCKAYNALYKENGGILSFARLQNMAIDITEWQKEQILDSNTTLQRTFELGKQEMKQQMMAKAVDATVHIDAGGYPYIPQMELYDYEKDIPFAKEGDKYKVILIKEN